MIRRNVDGQGPYKFPQLINLSGAFVTSGASVEVTKDGSKAAATNAPSHDTNGRWSWSPTEAETNCATMIAELIGPDGSSVVLNFVTTAADTSAVAFGANTTTPPTASQNASQVRTELTTELGRIDAAISSRSTLTAANVWDHATRSLTTFGTLVSDIWSNASRTLTAISDSAGITTLLTRIVGTLASGTHNAQSGDSFARLGAPAGASIAADIAAIDVASQGDWAITRTFQISGGTKVPGVQMSLVGVNGKVDTSGSDGVAQINTDDGTYTLRVSVPFGYEAVADSSLTINGADSTATVTLVVDSSATYPTGSPGL